MYGHFTSGQVSGSSSPRSEAPNLKSDEAAAVAILQHLNKEELQSLLENDDKLQDLILDLQQVKNIQTEREMLMTQNRSVAEYNISLRPKLESLKTKLATNYEEASSLKTTLAMDKSKLDALRGELSLDTVSVLLQTATAKTEEDAEEISDQFFDRKMDVETYLEQYLNKRTLSHLQLVKSQKLNELIRAQHSQAQQSNQQTSYNWGSGSQGGSYPAPPPIAQPGSGVPYPSGYPYHTGGAFQMPQTGNYNHR
ncbi:vacuolar protein sorting-associated protein 37B-like [Mizuhopecten yessoensis]|uniref:vacuolar protein sorting-associated protein 37B-like n=1 Tax=Mizuhopecten yessoensis TaxID=6573 RepID=UPI000B45C6A6|nr:vacuolar protein sorting-associated protein 37B-like [Mizuhopecten yessoensis]XP_021375640.1 vacuolar protein sorting-associated protein 37B-like [Mizuhopecten yessoensis]